MCCMAWMYELIATLFLLFTQFEQNHGIPNMYYPDAIIMFVVIPFVHLMNDEETKIIILEENWYQGLRHMLGIHASQVWRSTKETT